MDDSDRYEIATLAEAYETARQRLQMLRMQNQQSDPQKRVEQAVEYHVADAERLQAWDALDRAKCRAALKSS